MHDHLLEKLANACPFGLVTLSDAARVGISRFVVAEAARRGVLERLAPGLYREAGVPPPPWQNLAVAQRYLDGLRAWNARPTMPSAISGMGCLQVLGARITATEPRPLAAVPLHRRLRLTDPPFQVSRVCWDRTRVRESHRLRTVDPAHALADYCARTRDRPAAVRSVVDQARYDLSLTVPSLCQRWRELGILGAQRLLAMEREGVFEQESEGERAAYNALFAKHRHRPDCQVVVLGSFRADFVFLSAGLIIEYFGHEAHRDRFLADMTRLHALQAAGYLVIAVVGPMLREAAALSEHIYAQLRLRHRLIARGVITRPSLPMQPERMRPLQTL